MDTQFKHGLLKNKDMWDKLIFCEEFDGEQVDLNRWNYVHAGSGFGNKEWQFYRSDSDNIKIVNHQLVITAKKEIYEHRYFTSGKITTRGKFSFQYGKVEIVAKLPVGKGFWPALWMMPEDNCYGYWPLSGEIDIMESLGHQPEKIYGTIHYGNPHTYHGASGFIKNPEQFHKYAIVWEKEKISWYVDDVLLGSTSKWFSKSTVNQPYPAPFNQKFYLIINFAIGGAFSGYPDLTTTFPTEFIIDSIKVYQ